MGQHLTAVKEEGWGWGNTSLLERRVGGGATPHCCKGGGVGVEQ